MYRIAFLLSFATFTATGQSVTVSGLAPSYVGQDIEIYEIEDYFSMKERFITSTTVEKDSSFSLSLSSPYIQKIIIKAGINKGFLYIQPDTKYRLFVPEKNKYDPYRQNGNQIEIGFLSLDSTDVNYKILGFQRWIDHFVGNNYYLRSKDAVTYVAHLDTFKLNVEKAYKADTSLFFKTYVRFTIAGLDNVNNAAERNRYEKHDFYIKHTQVQYRNDAYMDYLIKFYQEMIPRLPSKTNQAVYDGVLQGSPSLVMKALGTEYTMINLRIREMMMINGLSEMYFSDEFPQTNILSILDSVANRSLFKSNAIIAKNLRDRLTELVPGGPAPTFVLSQTGKETKTLLGYQGKYVYLHFLDPNRIENIKELALLENIQKEYKDYVDFVTIYKEADSLDTAYLKQVKALDWDVYELSKGNSIWGKYRVESYPQYVLIDGTGTIVESPALGPTPDGQYRTIDRTFFYIKKKVDQENEPANTPYDGIRGE
ncbi:MAG: hypothetical protein ACI865_002141 [Flavobacteriaceae bacterium]|jgi:hypothetical protein